MSEANEGLHGFPSPQTEDRHPVPTTWRHFRLITPDHSTDPLITPPGVYQLGVACWGRGGLANSVRGHAGGGAGFCFIVLETRPGERLPEIVFDDSGDTQFGSLMVAHAGGDAGVSQPGVGRDASLFIDNAYAIKASGGDGGQGQYKGIPGVSYKLIVGGGGGGAGSFYGPGGRGGDAGGHIFTSDHKVCSSGASGGGFGGHGVNSGNGGSAPGGGGACHGSLSQTLSQGGQPPTIWKPQDSIMNPGLGGCGGGGTCSAGGNGRIQSAHETLSLGAQGGSGLNGRGGMGATEVSPASDGVSYPGSDDHPLIALANLRLDGGGGGGGNADFGDGGNGAPGGGGGGACANKKNGGGRGGAGGVGGGGGAAAALSLVPFSGGDSLFGGGGGGSIGIKATKPGACLLGGGGQGGYLGDPAPAAKACAILYW